MLAVVIRAMQSYFVGMSVKVGAVLAAKLVKVPLGPMTGARAAFPAKAYLAIVATEVVKAKAQRALAIGAAVARARHTGVKMG
jgi:hypothetical protein